MISFIRIAADLGDRRPVSRRMATLRETPWPQHRQIYPFRRWAGEAQACPARTAQVGGYLRDVLLLIRAVLRLFPAEGFEDGVSERVRQERWLGLPLMHLPRGTSSSRSSVSPPRSSRSIPWVKLSYSCRAHLRHNHLSHSNPAGWRLPALLKAGVRRSSPLTIASRATERSTSAGVFKSLVLRLRPGRLA
jgi:hypothetical protein